MGKTALARLWMAWLTVRTRAVTAQQDRGDVPGWVLITLMTAGIVTVLWAIAGPKLGSILSDALDGVAAPG